MGKSRIEAFSDGVIAIIITIMVLELKVPHDLIVVDAWRQTRAQWQAGRAAHGPAAITRRIA